MVAVNNKRIGQTRAGEKFNRALQREIRTAVMIIVADDKVSAGSGG